MNQFSRTQLLIGVEGINKLKSSRVAVFGIGGVGGHVAEALVRSGVGSVDLIDNDKFSLTNLNRQIFSTHKTIGCSKVEVAKERLLEINPDVVINTFDVFFNAETNSMFDFKNYDYVVDAIDSVSGKIQLVLDCQAVGTPIISSMGAGNKMNAAAFEVEDIYKTSVCPLAKVMRHELKKRGVKKLKVVYSKEEPIKPQFALVDSSELSSKKVAPGSNAFVPAVVGLIMAGEVVKDIISGF